MVLSKTLRGSGRLLGLLRRSRRGGLGLLEILESEKDGNRKRTQDQEGAKIASSAAGAWSLRLKIRILKFGQRMCPVVQRAAG